jgi:transcriptional regulator of arginine metabolism
MVAQSRRHRIVHLVRNRAIGSQQELVELLEAEGESVTQATVSRDLRALGVTKGPSGYLPPEAVSGGAPVMGEDALSNAIISITPADSLVVLRTVPGHAHAIGVLLDRMRPKGMVGCVAGDDTLFLATDSRVVARRLAANLKLQFQLGAD